MPSRTSGKSSTSRTSIFMPPPPSRSCRRSGTVSVTQVPAPGAERSVAAPADAGQAGLDAVAQAGAERGLAGVEAGAVVARCGPRTARAADLRADDRPGRPGVLGDVGQRLAGRRGEGLDDGAGDGSVASGRRRARMRARRRACGRRRPRASSAAARSPGGARPRRRRRRAARRRRGRRRAQRRAASGVVGVAAGGEVLERLQRRGRAARRAPRPARPRRRAAAARRPVVRPLSARGAAERVRCVGLPCRTPGSRQVSTC